MANRAISKNSSIGFDGPTHFLFFSSARRKGLWYLYTITILPRVSNGASREDIPSTSAAALSSVLIYFYPSSMERWSGGPQNVNYHFILIAVHMSLEDFDLKIFAAENFVP